MCKRNNRLFHAEKCRPMLVDSFFLDTIATSNVSFVDDIVVVILGMSSLLRRSRQRRKSNHAIFDERVIVEVRRIGLVYGSPQDPFPANVISVFWKRSLSALFSCKRSTAY
jgi:hypothetical protein